MMRKRDSGEQRFSRRGVMLFLGLSGGLAGYVVFHPFSMIMHAALSPETAPSASLFHPVSDSFVPGMMPMATAFSVFGAVIGVLLGALFDRRRRLHEAELEDERKRAAIDAVHHLMVTLSHYLLNANAVIGGVAARSRRRTKDPQLLKNLKTIEQEAHEIDRVLAALKNITEIRTTDYTSTGKDLMIDLSDSLTREIVASEADSESSA